MRLFSKRRIAFCAVSCALIIDGMFQELRAAQLGIVQVAGAPSGYVANDLQVTTGPGEGFGITDMWLRLNAGTIFQHSFGDDTTPDPSLLPIYPELAFDSYVNGVIVGASQGLGSPNSGGPAVVNNTTFDVRWAPLLGQDTQNKTTGIARMTLSNTATGLMSFAVASSTPANFRGEYRILNGVITLVPEPASIFLSILALAGLSYFTQRRGR